MANYSMQDNFKAATLAVVSLVVLGFFYGFFVFSTYSVPSYFSYAALHLFFALVIVLILAGTRLRYYSFRFGLIISLIIGIGMLIPHIIINKATESLAGIATGGTLVVEEGVETGIISLFNVPPNPFLYFAVFIVAFFIPFLLYSRISIIKTSIITVSIILLLLIGPPVFSIAKMGCMSYTCDPHDCFCKYTTTTSRSCPTCADICTEKGQTEAKTTLPTEVLKSIKLKTVSLTETPKDGTEQEIVSLSDPKNVESTEIECFCYCK
ncbi:MAG: hypothetical protein GY861_19810 [bacterium]|nr:hypothetical protein [bacterium]